MLASVLFQFFVHLQFEAITLCLVDVDMTIDIIWTHILVQSHEGNWSKPIHRQIYHLLEPKPCTCRHLFQSQCQRIHRSLDAGIIGVEFIQPFEQFCRLLALIRDQDFIAAIVQMIWVRNDILFAIRSFSAGRGAYSLACWPKVASAVQPLDTPTRATPCPSVWQQT